MTTALGELGPRTNNGTMSSRAGREGLRAVSSYAAGKDSQLTWASTKSSGGAPQDLDLLLEQAHVREETSSSHHRATARRRRCYGEGSLPLGRHLSSSFFTAANESGGADGEQRRCRPGDCGLLLPVTFRMSCSGTTWISRTLKRNNLELRRNNLDVQRTRARRTRRRSS